MPRKARIDAAGALQHIIVRGIERCRIFYDDNDVTAAFFKTDKTPFCVRKIAI